MSRRWLPLLLLALPAILPGQQPPARIRIVVYKLTPVPNNAATQALATAVGRALVHALADDSLFELMTYPGASGRTDMSRPTAQYAVVGGVAVAAGLTSVDLRILDIPNVRLLATQKLAIPDEAIKDPAGWAGRRLAKDVHDHFAAARR